MNAATRDRLDEIAATLDRLAAEATLAPELRTIAANIEEDPTPEGPVRIYVKIRGELLCDRTTNLSGLGRTLQVMRDDGVKGPIGVMFRPDPDESGMWLINPWSGGKG